MKVLSARDWFLRLQDIVEQIELIAEHTAGMDLDGFVSHGIAQGAVLYRMAILGEAVAGLPAAIEARYPRVSWHVLRAARDLMAEGYENVDLDRVWDLIARDLAPVADQLRQLPASDAEPMAQPATLRRRRRADGHGAR